MSRIGRSKVSRVERAVPSAAAANAVAAANAAAATGGRGGTPSQRLRKLVVVEPVGPGGGGVKPPLMHTFSGAESSVRPPLLQAQSSDATGGVELSMRRTYTGGAVMAVPRVNTVGSVNAVPQSLADASPPAPQPLVSVAASTLGVSGDSALSSTQPFSAALLQPLNSSIPLVRNSLGYPPTPPRTHNLTLPVHTNALAPIAVTPVGAEGPQQPATAASGSALLKPTPSNPQQSSPTGVSTPGAVPLSTSSLAPLLSSGNSTPGSGTPGSSSSRNNTQRVATTASGSADGTPSPVMGLGLAFPFPAAGPSTSPKHSAVPAVPVNSSPHGKATITPRGRAMGSARLKQTQASAPISTVNENSPMV